MATERVFKIRCGHSQFKRWCEAAQGNGLSASGWARRILDEESDKLIAELDDAAHRHAKELRQRVVAETFPAKTFKPDFKK